MQRLDLSRSGANSNVTNQQREQIGNNAPVRTTAVPEESKEFVLTPRSHPEGLRRSERRLRQQLTQQKHHDGARPPHRKNIQPAGGAMIEVAPKANRKRDSKYLQKNAKDTSGDRYSVAEMYGLKALINAIRCNRFSNHPNPFANLDLADDKKQFYGDLNQALRENKHLRTACKIVIQEHEYAVRAKFNIRHNGLVSLNEWDWDFTSMFDRLIDTALPQRGRKEAFEGEALHAVSSKKEPLSQPVHAIPDSMEIREQIGIGYPNREPGSPADHFLSLRRDCGDWITFSSRDSKPS